MSLLIATATRRSSRYISRYTRKTQIATAVRTAVLAAQVKHLQTVTGQSLPLGMFGSVDIATAPCKVAS